MREVAGVTTWYQTFDSSLKQEYRSSFLPTSAHFSSSLLETHIKLKATWNPTLKTLWPSLFDSFLLFWLPWTTFLIHFSSRIYVFCWGHVVTRGWEVKSPHYVHISTTAMCLLPPSHIRGLLSIICHRLKDAFIDTFSKYDLIICICIGHLALSKTTRHAVILPAFNLFPYWSLPLFLPSVDSIWAPLGLQRITAWTSGNKIHGSLGHYFLQNDFYQKAVFFRLRWTTSVHLGSVQLWSALCLLQRKTVKWRETRPDRMRPAPLLSDPFSLEDKEQRTKRRQRQRTVGGRKYFYWGQK